MTETSESMQAAQVSPAVCDLEPQLSQLLSPRLGINLANREPIVGRRLSNFEGGIPCDEPHWESCGIPDRCLPELGG